MKGQKLNAYRSEYNPKKSSYMCDEGEKFNLETVLRVELELKATFGDSILLLRKILLKLEDFHVSKSF